MRQSVTSRGTHVLENEPIAHYHNEVLLLGWIAVSLLAAMIGVLILLWGQDSITTTTISYWDVGALFLILAIILTMRSVTVYILRSNNIEKNIYYEQRTAYSLVCVGGGLIAAFIYPLVAYRR